MDIPDHGNRATEQILKTRWEVLVRQLAFAAGVAFAIAFFAIDSEAATATTSVTPAADLTPAAKRVVGCFAGRNSPPNIAEMHDCSGFWVTPRVLLWCLLGKQCSVMSDTIEDRATFDSVLAAQGLNPNTVLTLKVAPTELGPMPDVATIEHCQLVIEQIKDQEAKKKDFQDCVLQAQTANQYAGMRNCFEKPDSAEKLKCIGDKVGDKPFKDVLTCLGSAKPTLDKLVECNASDDLKQKIVALHDCPFKVDSMDKARECFMKDLEPQYGKLAKCVAEAKEAKDEDQAINCFSTDQNMSKATKLVRCLSKDHNSPISCSYDLIDSKVDANAIEVMKCIEATTDGLGKVSCVSLKINPALLRARRIFECVVENSTKDNSDRPVWEKDPPVINSKDNLQTCASQFLNGDVAANFASCASMPSANWAQCFQSVPDLQKAAAAFKCASEVVAGVDQDGKSFKATGASDAAMFACVAGLVGGNASKIAGCLANSQSSYIAFCLLGNSAQVRLAQQLYNCITNGSDFGSLVGNCSQALPINEKSRQTMVCVARAGADRTQLAACAAGIVLPASSARMLGCIASSQGATSFALCAARPGMNEEWRIAAECAASTGGIPVATMGCAMGRLTVRELLKCLDGKCFGENNTVVVTVKTIVHDLTHGLGKNNEIVKAMDAIKDVTGGPNSVVNKPAQIWGGPNSMFNNPGQIWGGPGSIFRKPNQIWGGPNSVFNNPPQLLGGADSFARNPLGGPDSFLSNPLGALGGGSNSEANKLIRHIIPHPHF